MRSVVWLMRSLFFLLVVAATVSTVSAQYSIEARQPRVLLLLDGSSSMQQPWSGEGSQARFATAARIIERLMDSVYAVNPGVEFGLRVYGHQYGSAENNCYDSRREVMYSKNNRTQMGLRLANLHPQGVSPIAYSIGRVAAEDLDDGYNHSYAVILITDGGESCGGDICAAVQQFLKQKIYFKPYIIGLAPVEGMKSQYECLGQYLQVTTESELAPAVGTIVEDYRRALQTAVMVSRPIATTTAVPAPQTEPRQVPVIAAPPAAPTAEPGPKYELALLASAAGSKGLSVARGAAPTYRTRTVPRFAVPTAEPDPAPPAPAPVPANYEVALLSRRVVPLLPVVRRATPPVYAARTAPRFALPQPEPREPEAPLAALRIAASRPGVIVRGLPPAPTRVYTPQKFALPKFEPDPAAAVVAAAPPTVRATTAPPQPTVKPPFRDTPRRESPKPASRPAARPATPVAGTPAPKVAEASITSTADAESGLEIYFTDGKGTYYKSTPQMLLLDSKTGATTQKFYRFINADGKPEVQKAPPGKYDVLVAGRANLIVRGVELEAGKRTRVDIKVSNGSLKFGYMHDRKRPMKEFEALVNRRFAPGPVIRQRCTAELEYEPGNYYIEVNTTPISRHNIDLEFGVQMEILIPEPGWVQFTNSSPVGYVALFHQLGDRFVRFAGMTLDGRPEQQKMRLQPGPYEVHWIPNPNVPYAKERVVRFSVKSDQTTSVEL